jgi:hypothetical protein
VLAPALGQQVLFVRFYHRELLDFAKITTEAGFRLVVTFQSAVASHPMISTHCR